jgi:molybdate transport system ATP-binding protein
MSDLLLRARFRKKFPHGGLDLTFALEADLGETPFHVLFGPSAAGKTTILRCLAGLAEPDEGNIALGETWYCSERKIALAPQKRRIGYISQEPALFPHLTVAGNLAYGTPAQGNDKIPPKIVELLELGHLLTRRPSQLSGGEKQRVALGRSLATRPRLLLLDEPFSALDQPSREALRLRLRSLLREFRVPAVLVTHDRTEAFSLADHVHLLDRGHMLESGEAARVFLKPRTLRAAQIVGIENFFRWEGRNFAARAEDVFFSSERSQAEPESRHFRGYVSEITPEGALTRIRLGLEDGSTLTALVPRKLVEREKIETGRQLTARLTPQALWEVQT